MRITEDIAGMLGMNFEDFSTNNREKDGYELVLVFLKHITHKLNKLEESIKKLMAQTDDLTAAENQLDADTLALTQEQTQAFTDLEAAVAAGKTGTDLTPFIARLQTNHTAMVAALAAAQAADVTVNPPGGTTAPAKNPNSGPSVVPAGS